MAVIGTCSLCGGPVTTPDVWMGILPPVPMCESCGATQKNPHGPVIPMEKKPDRTAIQDYSRAKELGDICTRTNRVDFCTCAGKCRRGCPIHGYYGNVVIT